MENIKGNILARLQGTQESLPTACQRICTYILNNPIRVLELSVHELASCSKTGDSTVIRFCRLLGFDSYRSFIVSLSSALTSVNSADNVEQFTDIHAGDSLSEIIDNISRMNHQSIEDSLSVLDSLHLDLVSNRLLKAEHIIFCGIGASGLICMDAEQKFMRIGKSCHSFVDGHSQLTAAALLEETDVAFLISNSGETKDILDTLSLLKEKGICTISLTRYGKNTLAQNSDIPLFISTPEILFRSAAMGSRIAMLNVIDIIYATVVSRSYEKSKQNLLSTRKALRIKSN